MTIFCPDLSHYNAGVDVTGAPAVIAKATQGTWYDDSSYAAFKAAAAAAGAIFAAYHWVEGSDPVAQAAHVYGVVGPGVPVMWDTEAVGATVGEVLALTRAYRALGGNPRLVYLPHWWWQKLGSPDLSHLAAAGLALVSSNYTTYSDTGPGWAPYGGIAPAIWQYTSSAPMGGQRVDRNAFRGTVDQLRALLGLTTTGGDMAILIAEQDGPNQSAVWLSNGVTRRSVATEAEMAMLRSTGLATNANTIPVLHAQLAEYGVDVAAQTGGAAPVVDASAIAAALVADPTFLSALGKAAAGATNDDFLARFAKGSAA